MKFFIFVLVIVSVVSYTHSLRYFGNSYSYTCSNSYSNSYSSQQSYNSHNSHSVRYSYRNYGRTTTRLFVDPVLLGATPSTYPFTWRGMVLYLPQQNSDSNSYGNSGSNSSNGGENTAKPPVLIKETTLLPTEISDSALDSESQSQSQSQSQLQPEGYAMPLLPESTALFPGGRGFLYINEMKFRCLFAEMHKYHDRLVRTFINQRTGEIHPIGLVCKVIETKRMKSGTAAYIIQGMYRVRLVSLLQKEPYVTTGVHFVESNEEDGIHMNSSNSNGIQNAEKYFVDMIDDLQQISDTDLDLVRGISDKLHKDLCCYMRLARIRILETKKKSPNFDATEETKKLITLTPSIYKNRPSVNSIEVNRVDQLRRYQLYSYAVGNLISTTPSTMHRLLSVGLVERLQGLASIMSGAADSLAKDMLASKTITDKEYRDLTLSEGDEDLMPSPDYQELSLSLVEFEEEEVVDEDEDSTSSKASEEINEVESSSAVDDPWDHPDAFQ